MHFQSTIILSSLVAAASAVSTCASGAPSVSSRDNYWFSRQSNGIHVATWPQGYANYAAPSLNSKQGVLQIVNQSQTRKSICLMKGDVGFTCYWLNAGDTCKTNIQVSPEWSVKVVGDV
nr:uncharacterized protein CTRU02_11838 [Colletotrichum truncatum]KAF6785213.1 hypothetical protein CTRU02_11838 [Colletotrichum truncatum]